MLQSACYIVCAYLTGMRNWQLQAMRAGCLNVRRSEDRLIERYQIRSAVYKRRDVRGQAENWITIEPVAKAIAVLERLTQHLRRAARSSTMAEVERVSDIDCRPRALGDQVAHFYSQKKNTTEMIRMMDLLLGALAETGRSSISHGTRRPGIFPKRLFERIDENNKMAAMTGGPIVETAPLPARAQFLNVIECDFQRHGASDHP